MYNLAKARAKRAGLEFTIKVSDIKIPEYCPYLGVKITKDRGKGLGRVVTNASLDRIDNSKGYTPDNIQVISWKANNMKNMATIEELKVFAENILRVHS